MQSSSSVRRVNGQAANLSLLSRSCCTGNNRCEVGERGCKQLVRARRRTTTIDGSVY